MKKILVCGAGGFIGTHLVTNLKKQGYYVIGADLKFPEYSQTDADEFHLMDLRNQKNVESLLTDDIYEIYQLAADMGGAGYIFTGDNDADIMHNSVIINLNILSSACIYPSYNQKDPGNPNCAEDSVYPADPDSDYGWEKLFSERLYQAFARNHGMQVRIARFHNVFGPEGTYSGGREKAPAAMCRKVAEAEDGGVIEVWGDGKQTRSFLYIDECLEAVERFMNGSFEGPVNIGSEEMVSLNHLAQLVIDISGKKIGIKNVPVSYEGVRGRKSDNRLIKEKLGWAPSRPLREGIEKNYKWVLSQVTQSVSAL